MKRAHSNVSQSTNLPSSEFMQMPIRTSTPSTVNSPHIYQRQALQVSGLSTGIIGNSQSVLTPTVNPVVPVNRSSIRPTILSVGVIRHSPSLLNRPMSQMLFTNRNSVRPTILNVEIICNSQSGLNSPIDQLVSTNVRIISLSRDAVSRPQLTPEIFQTAIQEIIKNNLESAMQIIGVTTIEELAYSTDVKGNTLLAHAAEYGDAKPIKILLSKILDPQQLTQIKNNAGKTAILLAAQNGHAKAITALLKGVSNRQRLVEQIDAQGNSALHYAASYGHAPAITAILSDGINKQLIAERQNNFGYSALMLAADKGYVEVIASIFSAVNNRQPLAEQINNFGQTVLMNGLLSGASALVITEILESIEDPEKLIFHVNNEGLNLFTYALMRGNIDAAIVIFDKAKDKTTLLFKKNDPNEEAAIQIMSPEIKDIFIKKFYESNH
jgi:ankyrin repeat protein